MDFRTCVRPPLLIWVGYGISKPNARKEPVDKIANRSLFRIACGVLPSMNCQRMSARLLALDQKKPHEINNLE